MEPSRDAILEGLSRVIDPELRKPVTELDMVRAIKIDGGRVGVTIALTIAGCPLRSSFEDQVAREVGTIAGVESVELVFNVASASRR
jgi:ATP-binding protein involved in chromosome partitioning